jgi:hypothetical protein
MNAGMHSPGDKVPSTVGSQPVRETEAQDYKGDMNGPGMPALVPTNREHYWQERGRYSPPRNWSWSRDQHLPD